MKCIRRTVFVVPEEDVHILGRLQGTLAWLADGGPLQATNIDSIAMGLAMMRRMRPTEIFEPVLEAARIEDIEVELA